MRKTAIAVALAALALTGCAAHSEPVAAHTSAAASPAEQAPTSVDDVSSLDEAVQWALTVPASDSTAVLNAASVLSNYVRDDPRLTEDEASAFRLRLIKIQTAAIDDQQGELLSSVARDINVLLLERS